MILAKGPSPWAVFSRRLPILIGAGLLAGCQIIPHAAAPAARADDWQVIERLGEVRYLAPGTGSWAAALPATPLPAGSQVATGDGGRLILARASDHITAGPASRFNLPDGAPAATLKQTAGRLRYRLGEAPAFAVATPALAIEVRGSVFDVTVSADATDVAVERGRLRVATPDGEREIELKAGQSAEAGKQRALAFRRASGQPLQPVERIVVPALQPKSVVAEGALPVPQLAAAGAASDRASTSAAASAESAIAGAAVGPALGSTKRAAPPGAGATVPATTEATSGTLVTKTVEPEPDAAADAPVSAPAPVGDPAPKAAPPGDPRLLFDRLTEGMIDAIPAHRAPKESPVHARSI